MNNILIPPPLKIGDTIGIIAPSSPFSVDAIKNNVQYFEQKGFRIQYGAHIYDAERFLAGKDEHRASDLMEFVKDPNIKAIMVARGGQGSQRVLPLLDYKLIQQHPKMLIGFSDTTALQLGLLKRAGLVTFSGFTLTLQMGSYVEESLNSCLYGNPYSISGGNSIKAGIVSGSLMGGNLSLLSSLLGTPYQPNFQGSILLLEDVLVEPYNVDRMLSHLYLAGIFDQIIGIIFGEFDKCISSHGEDEGTIADVIEEWSLRMRVPCITNFPYGHGKRQCVLPIGKTVELNANLGQINID